jgi:GH15 family glucan-1,4-alpha-glucosidase
VDDSHVTRIDGYAPIRDYAAIGDGRTCALVARDGSIDWLCLPDVDSGAVFARILDAECGGSLRLEPAEPFESDRRYREGSNVLETTFRTAQGTVRVTDAMTMAHRERLAPLREIVRKVEGLSGRMRMRWSLEPRFDFGRARVRSGRRVGRVVFESRHGALALGVFDAGETRCTDGRAEGEFTIEQGRSALLDLTFAYRGPLVLPMRDDAERALEWTDRFWREWSGRAEYDGPYREAVVRSALTLKLLVFSPSGAIVAAPTTSLPEQIGGKRNWDYRYAWLRDAVWSLDVMLSLGYHDEATAFFSWFMHASRLTQPRLNVLYRVNGDTRTPEREVSGIAGYRNSCPVRVGNGAAEQLQLDVYGSVLDGIARYVESGRHIDEDTAKEVAEIADKVAEIWHEPDAGIWEVRAGPFQHTHSKAMCWLALDRAARLARDGVIPDRRERWEPAADDARRFWEENGWSDRLGSYVRALELQELDGSLLTLFVLDCAVAPERMQGTIDAVQRGLAEGPFVYRYRGADGLEHGEGAFVACSFWLVCALAKAGRREEAEPLMEQLLDAANDVGLYSEEIDPKTREFLGNFPQGLSHLALVNAAMALS